jgi:hypothetical protein
MRRRATPRSHATGRSAPSIGVSSGCTSPREASLPSMSRPSNDVQTLSIASSRGAAVARRDTSHFEGCGIEVIDPWAAVRR